MLEVEPGLQQYPEQVDEIWLPGSGGVQVPLARAWSRSNAARAAGGDPPGPVPGGDAHLQPRARRGAGQRGRARAAGRRRIGLPRRHAAPSSRQCPRLPVLRPRQPLLILAALLTIYIVLGVLYEHLLHPVTILSTLPTAGLGALLALLVAGTPFTVIALIGVILLMGIVKKNAIMMVDFALERRARARA